MFPTGEIDVMEQPCTSSAFIQSIRSCEQAEMQSNIRDISPVPTFNMDLPTVHVAIMRSNILKMLISEFQNSALLHSQVELLLINDSGAVEEGCGIGLTREVLCLFWREFYTALSVDGSEKVLAIRHDYQRSEWVSIARIVMFGYKEVGHFPRNTSRAFFASCIVGEEVIPDSCWIDSFKLYMSKDEQEVLNKCFQEAFDPEDEDILDFLSA